eukprot:Amastigsp_a508389_369.p4 type:complete len:159 gc:universal Amastigsp_a508389_369:133-609(+)
MDFAFAPVGATSLMYASSISLTPAGPTQQKPATTDPSSHPQNNAIVRSCSLDETCSQSSEPDTESAFDNSMSSCSACLALPHVVTDVQQAVAVTTGTVSTVAMAPRARVVVRTVMRVANLHVANANTFDDMSASYLPSISRDAGVTAAVRKTLFQAWF